MAFVVLVTLFLVYLAAVFIIRPTRLMVRLISCVVALFFWPI